MTAIEQKRIPISVSIKYTLQLYMQKLAEKNGNSISHEYNKAVEEYVERNKNS